jgi:hypothetical protein
MADEEMEWFDVDPAPTPEVAEPAVVAEPAPEPGPPPRLYTFGRHFAGREKDALVFAFGVEWRLNYDVSAKLPRDEWEQHFADFLSKPRS